MAGLVVNGEQLVVLENGISMGSSVSRLLFPFISIWLRGLVECNNILAGLTSGYLSRLSAKGGLKLGGAVAEWSKALL